MSSLVRIALTMAVALVIASPARAQFSVSIANWDVRAFQQEQIDENHGILRGSVEIERGDTKLFADEMEYFRDKELVIARGNVVMTQANSRIAADTAEFNTRTRLATFHHANGIAPVQQPRQTMQSAGPFVPQMIGQDNDVYFFGETVEKQGPKKYKITNGGFTTCVQPTKRWELSANTLILNVDHYTLLKNAILSVKGVPMLYLPIMYYPTKEDGRATGFLIPTYGHDGVRGHSIHNEFFWAINRSQDASILYDYYSKTGGGGGLEYRYVRTAGFGNFTAYRLDQRQTVLDNGATLLASSSNTLKGDLFQALPARMLARANINYFSSLQANQTFYTDIASIANNNSYVRGNVVGAWRSYSLNANVDRSQAFQGGGSDVTRISGSLPRINFSKSERTLGENSPLYFGATSELVYFDNLVKTGGAVTEDRSLGRVDFSPQLRYPFKKWQWFTVNTTAAWRETYYTRSLEPTTADDGTVTSTVVDDNLHRGYGTFTAQAVGPVFNRVWNTPNNGYAERFKHSIEPNFQLQRTTAIENYARILATDATDTQFGDTTTFTYGLNNRLYAKRKLGTVAVAQEIVALEVYQSYYTNPLQAQVDPRYGAGFGNGIGKPTLFSPLAANLRVSPSPSIQGSMRAEMDSTSKRLRTVSANGNLNWTQTISANIGWSKKFFIADLPGWNNKDLLDHTLNGGVNVRTRDNKYGVNSSLALDARRGTFTNLRVNGFYNSQCCGLAIEYSRVNYGSASFYPARNIFFFSFTLAGLGNFSPMSGGLNGIPR